MQNRLQRLFSRLNKEKVRYCIVRKYENLPNKTNGDVDLVVVRKDLDKARKVVSKEFFYYPYTQPHYFYFSYDKDVGLINLDLIEVEKLPELKKMKGFYVPKIRQEIRVKKSLGLKIWTNLQRKANYFMKGRLFCFVGPDGSGKSALAAGVISALEKYPLKKDIIYFGTRKGGRIYRTLDLIVKILRVYLNIFLGRITITDRYIFLTFRKRPGLAKLVRKISPKPRVVFVATAKPEEVRKRKKDLTIDEIKDMYSLYSNIKNRKEIRTDKPLKESIEDATNLILSKIN